MITQHFLTDRMKSVSNATYGLNGIKRALDEEVNKEEPNNYTLGALIAGMGVIVSHLDSKLHEIGEAAGIPDYD